MRLVTFILTLSITLYGNVNVTEKAYIKAVALHYSIIHKVDYKLVLAVIHVESSYRPLAKGGLGEVGLMQLHPKFFPKASYNIKKNIAQGVKHLAYVKKYCPNKEGKSWVICYNIGFKKVIDYRKHPYYNKVINEYRRLL